MKYGKVLSYKDVEEAKSLIGKQVVACDVLWCITEEPMGLLEFSLDSVNEKDIYPYKIGGEDFQFIREVLEKGPKFRPYKNSDEMIADFKKRFNNKEILPCIWIKGRVDHSINLIISFYENEVSIEDCIFDFNEISKSYTYLDGSPVGVLENV